MRRLRLPESVPCGIEVWRLTLHLAAPASDADWALLSADECAHAFRLRRPDDRVRAVATRAALRRLLGSRLEQAPHQLRFTRNRFGKPGLSRETSVDFNVSHAGGFALIALSKSGAVGVDIEHRTAEVDEAELAMHVFSPVERALGRDLQLEFFDRWTVKESVLKALGVGVAEHLQDLSVLRAEEGGSYRLRHTWPHWLTLDAWALAAPYGYAAALARADCRYEVRDDAA